MKMRMMLMMVESALVLLMILGLIFHLVILVWKMKSKNSYCSRIARILTNFALVLITAGLTLSRYFAGREYQLYVMATGIWIYCTVCSIERIKE